MGKLFDAIKKNYEALLKFQNDQEQDYLKTTNFNNLYKVQSNINYLNFMIDEVNSNAREYFGDYDKYRKYLNDNSDIYPKNAYNIPKARYTYTGLVDVKTDDFKAIFDSLENTIGKNKTDLLISKFEKYNPEANLKVESHPFNDKIQGIINDLDVFNLEQSKLNSYKDALLYANNELIIKKGFNEVDHVIDAISLTRDTKSKEYIKDYANEIGSNGEKVDAFKENTNALLFDPKNNEKKELLKPFVSHEPSFSEEYKNKIIALDKLITEKGLIPDGAVGETDFKEYGFIDYFDKAKELKNAILNYEAKANAEEKEQDLENIVLKSNELKEISNKYNDVIDFIKTNFDLNKIALPGNVYGGRPHDLDHGNINSYIPNLPVRWDYENAPYGVILSGFAQLKGAAKLANVSIEEYLNNPVKSYLKGAKKFLENEDDKYILTRGDGNTLGKRIAHALVMDENAYKTNMTLYSRVNRGVEFLNTTSNLDDNSLKNVISSAAGVSLYSVYDHSADVLFADKFENDYDSLQNMFALGGLTDNLLSLSNKYYNSDINKPDLFESYNTTIKSMKDVNPLNQTRRVMETIKDYMVERKRLFEERKTNYNGISLEDKIKPAAVFVAAKKYMNDYIYKNNINLLSLDKKHRQEVFDFLEDPVKAFEKKYEDEPNFYKTKLNGDLLENADTIGNEVKKEFSKLYKQSGDDFIKAFKDINNQTKGLNSNKNLNDIIFDNKGGYWEQKIGTTSKEYRALASAFVAATNPESPTYGDLNGVGVYAQKYIDHKLPVGADFNKLKENEKRRIEFCHTIIGAINKMKMDKQMEENKVVLAPDNNVFQDNLKKALDANPENNNIIQDEEIANENIIEQ